MEILARQLAYEYNIGSAMSVLFSYRGTFWPHVLRTHELYLYPLLHTGLVLVQWRWQQQAEEQAGGVDSGRGTFWRTFFEVTADEDGLEVGPQQYWEKNNMMIPWKAVGALTPLMVFALAPTYEVGLAAIVLVGATSGGFHALNGAVTSKVTEVAFMGRVMSLNFLAFAGFSLISPLTGRAGDLFGVNTVLLGMGVVVLAIALVMFGLVERDRRTAAELQGA